MTTITVAARIADILQAIKNCEQSGNNIWRARHIATLHRVVEKYLPSGGGWDRGTQIKLDVSRPRRLCFHGSFHHMKEGAYDGWTDHDVFVVPMFAGLRVHVTGRDRDGVLEDIAERFIAALNEPVFRDAGEG